MMYDENEVRKAISIMKNQNDLFEVRIVASSKKNISGYFRDAETCINALRAAHINDNCNVYITLNGIRDECYSRQQRDRFMNNVTPTTTDSDIDLYTWFLVDIDPVRAAGTSSSEEQITLAKKKSNEVYLFMKQTGFEEPIVGFSGNGVHLLYSVGLAVNEENKQLVKDCLAVLSLFFSDDKVSVDTANFNPARVCKLYGTLAQKGANTPERPHRMSHIVQAPEHPKQNDKALLQKLAGYLPVPDRPQGYNRFNPRDFDLDQWLDEHGLHYTKASYGSGTKYILEHCPFDENHAGKDACIFRMSNGAIGFHCFHNSCADRTGQDVRRMFEKEDAWITIR